MRIKIDEQKTDFSMIPIGSYFLKDGSISFKLSENGYANLTDRGISEHWSHEPLGAYQIVEITDLTYIIRRP
jgi:hypothetical protein